MSGDISSVTRALRNPIENNLFYGFDGICATYAATTGLIIGGAVISTMIFWYGWERPLAPYVWIIQRRKRKLIPAPSMSTLLSIGSNAASVLKYVSQIHIQANVELHRIEVLSPIGRCTHYFRRI
jgi:hypothetical protein